MNVWVPQINLLAYPKPMRLPVGPVRMPEKEYMNEKDTKYLFSGRVLVEEKMDGKPFSFSAERFIVFSEDLKIRHSIFYKIPARFAVFDIYDAKRGVVLSGEGKKEVFSYLKRNQASLPDAVAGSGIFLVNLVESGRFSLGDMPALVRESAYAYEDNSNKKTFMEGIVVKPDRDLFLAEHLSGKLVREEFVAGITRNYMELPKRYNKINPAFENARGEPSQVSP